MNRQLYIVFSFFAAFLLLPNLHVNSQDADISLEQSTNSKLFIQDAPLSIKWSYSIKELKKNTNDSTYITRDLSYQEPDSSWTTMKVGLRARGNFRKENCYFPPVKLKLEDSLSHGTLFAGQRRLKLVLPCLLQTWNNDYVVKEYIAYKLYEIITPYSFKTRMVRINFTEEKGKKTKEHQLLGILIEDDKQVANRFDGNVINRFIHPLNLDATASVHNAFFQYMIGNTDYSTAYQHNEKLLFIDKKIIPLPYDFDMSGLVDASYAVVSQVQNQSLDISSVTERQYRGFKREKVVFNQVRVEFIEKKETMMQVLKSHEDLFENPKTYSKARDYILEFFNILESEAKFLKEIVLEARTK